MSLNRWHIPTSEQEIVGVFVEEVEDLLENIDHHMRAWEKDPADQKALTEIRRSFHTLKGSGRMVKALDMSEMAWKVERMLNQAIAGAVPVSEPMIKLVAAVQAQIPKMTDAFKNQRPVVGMGAIESLMNRADAIATGRTQAPVPPTAVATARDRQRSTLHELNLKLDRCMQRADEALHRSEMALQESRRASTLTDSLNNRVGQRNWGAEMERLTELVNLLSKEISDVRLETLRSQKDAILQRSEVNQLVEQRVRARLASSVERLRGEIGRDMEEHYRAASAHHRFGWMALILSALLGAMIATGLFISIQLMGTH